MAKTYWLKFGTGSAATNTGLSPTFTVFSLGGSASIAAPAILEAPAGSGLYKFTYSPTTVPVVFEADGGAALANADRYIDGSLDPMQNMNESVTDFSNSFGSTSVDPTTILGYLKRVQEYLEGTQTFNKNTGIWDISSRGASTLLVEKTLSNSTTQATRT